MNTRAQLEDPVEAIVNGLEKVAIETLHSNPPFDQSVNAIYRAGWSKGWKEGRTQGILEGKMTLTNSNFFWVWIMTLTISLVAGIIFGGLLFHPM